MGYLAPTPVLGLKLPDMATIQAFEPLEMNSNSMKIENGIKDDRTRLTDLETRATDLEVLPSLTVDADTSNWWDMDGNWTLIDSSAAYTRETMTLRISVKRKMTQIPGVGDGNIANDRICTNIYANKRPCLQAPLMTTSAGPNCSFYIGIDGVVYLSAVPSNHPINVDDVLTFGGTFMRAIV